MEDSAVRQRTLGIQAPIGGTCKAESHSPMCNLMTTVLIIFSLSWAWRRGSNRPVVNQMRKAYL